LKIFFSAGLLGLFLCLLPVSALAADWQELKGDHFIIYYDKNGDFAKETLRFAETYYTRIASDLGYARHSDFWQWENRVEIYLYPTEAEYLKATGQPAWSKGVANYTDKKISSFVWSQGFQDSLLPHEIAHLIFRDFVGFKGEVPLWLDEGVAQWQEPRARQMARQAGHQVYTERGILPFDDFTEVNTTKLDTFSEKSVHQFYMQALSVVDYLIQYKGTQVFAEFCRQLREGKGLNEALGFAFGGDLLNLDALQNKWIKYVTEV